MTAVGPPLGTTRAVQCPASRGEVRLECDSWALRDALLVECDSPDTLSPPKASASTPPQCPADHQIKELRATAEAAKTQEGRVKRGWEGGVERGWEGNRAGQLSLTLL